MDKTFLLIMSHKELNRLDIIKRLEKGELKAREASDLLNLSIRHTKRLKASFKEHGAKALTHGNRGKKGNRCMPDEEKEKIVKLLKDKYPDFWPTHATEKLEENHKITRDPKTIRKIMMEEGLWKPKRNKNKEEHREWRQRKAHYGEMEQFDGSYHHWLEDRGDTGEMCLLLSVDDATGKMTHAKFDDHEGFFPVIDFWQEYLLKHGKPMSIYMDRFSTYSMNQKLAKENPDTLTQFQRAMKELRIEPILAKSPQAKGRVEKMFKTLQNRLVKEMRLKKINTVEEANKYLQNEFIPYYNDKYAVQPRSKADLHNKLSENEKKKLPSIFTRQEQRTVQNDFTISYKTNWFQLTKHQPVTIQKKDKVVVEEKRDHSINIRLRGKYLNYKPIQKGQKEIIKTSIPRVIAAGEPIKEKTSILNQG